MLKILTGMCVLFLSSPAFALPIVLDLPLGNSASSFSVPFSELNGLALDGQNLSLEFSFGDNFVLASDDHHAALLRITTSNIGPSMPTTLAGTGAFLDQTGSAIVGPMSLVTGGSNIVGVLAASLYSDALMSQTNPIDAPFYYYGLQYNVTLPVLQNQTITNAQIIIARSEHVYGVPDHGATLRLTALVWMAVLAVARHGVAANG